MAGEQLEQPRHTHPRPELAVRQLDRRVATPDGVGHEVRVDGERDGQSRSGCVGHSARW
jgi:hypothetical protein